MIENIGPIITLYKALTEGFRSLNIKTKSKRKHQIQRNIISVQIILENIIETADQIYSVVDSQIHKDAKLDKASKDELKDLAISQRNNLQELLMILRDDTFKFILKLFAPQLRRDILDHIHMKGGRIEELIWNLRNIDSRKLNKLYNKEYYQEGVKLLSQLKNCSKELSGFIKTHINLEEAILNL